MNTAVQTDSHSNNIVVDIGTQTLTNNLISEVEAHLSDTSGVGADNNNLCVVQPHLSFTHNASRFDTGNTGNSTVISRSDDLPGTNDCKNDNQMNKYPVDLHNIVFNSGVPNYHWMRIPVRSTLNIPLWKTLSAGYDCAIIEY